MSVGADTVERKQLGHSVRQLLDDSIQLAFVFLVNFVALSFALRLLVAAIHFIFVAFRRPCIVIIWVFYLFRLDELDISTPVQRSTTLHLCSLLALGGEAETLRPVEEKNHLFGNVVTGLHLLPAVVALPWRRLDRAVVVGV